jgi:hypothetical protein
VLAAVDLLHIFIIEFIYKKIRTIQRILPVFCIEMETVYHISTQVPSYLSQATGIEQICMIFSATGA